MTTARARTLVPRYLHGYAVKERRENGRGLVRRRFFVASRLPFRWPDWMTRLHLSTGGRTLYSYREDWFAPRPHAPGDPIGDLLASLTTATAGGGELAGVEASVVLGHLHVLSDASSRLGFARSSGLSHDPQVKAAGERLIEAVRPSTDAVVAWRDEVVKERRSARAQRFRQERGRARRKALDLFQGDA